MKAYKITAVFLVTVILFIYINFLSGIVFCVKETPVSIYTGSRQTESIYKNLDYIDIDNLDGSIKETIYELGALDIMKGYGSKIFNPDDTLTVEQALALIYNMVGKEAEAQQAAEALDLARARARRKYPAPKMWSDGYIQLALNDNLITAKEYNDAIRRNQFDLKIGDFQRNASISRQDMAEYIAKILKLKPINKQVKIFNSFKDWQETDPHKISYLEAVVQNRIMNSSPDGYFHPKAHIKRKEAAQIIKNAETFILPILGYEKKTGVIEDIINEDNTAGGNKEKVKVIYVRTSDGKLEQIRLIKNKDETYVNYNEQTGAKEGYPSRDVLVYSEGKLGFSNLLDKDKTIQYIANKNKEVLFINVMPQTEKKYILGVLNILDTSSKKIGVSPYITVPSLDISNIRSDAIFNKGKDKQAIMPYSGNIFVLKDMVKKDISQLQKGENVLITVVNGVAVRVEAVDLYYLEKQGIVSGIVEDNNPQLGYITLYFEDGSGSSPLLYRQMLKFRTYSYSKTKNLKIYRNRRAASVDEIIPGDSVYLKLDSKNKVLKVSAADNLYPVYGKVRLKGSSFLGIKCDDGTYEHLSVEPSTLVVKNRRVFEYDKIAAGDYVKLLVQKTPSYTFVKRIVVEDGYELIDDIYKGDFQYYDEISGKVIVSNLKRFRNGDWIPILSKRFSKLTFSEGYMPVIPVYAQGEAYFAMKEDYTGREKIAKMFLRNVSGKSFAINGEIAVLNQHENTLSLLDDDALISYSEDSIIMKNGRLISGNNLKYEDLVYIFADRDAVSGNYRASLIVTEKKDLFSASIYRGRIKSILKGKEFKLESFSKFDGSPWNFINTEKTFLLDPSETFILDEEGIVNIDEFNGEKNSPYLDEDVYILADGIKALAVSTAPYGKIQAVGKISGIFGAKKDIYGNYITKPNKLTLSEVKVYNPQTYLWSGRESMEITIPQNALLVKDGKTISVEDLGIGDRIRVIRSEDTASGDGYVFIVEK